VVLPQVCIFALVFGRTLRFNTTPFLFRAHSYLQFAFCIAFVAIAFDIDTRFLLCATDCDNCTTLPAASRLERITLCTSPCVLYQINMIPLSISTHVFYCKHTPALISSRTHSHLHFALLITQMGRIRYCNISKLCKSREYE